MSRNDSLFPGRLPIKLDATSNGEFEPVPLEPVHHHANLLANETASANAKRLNLSRRRFLVSSAGAAATLLAFNSAYALAKARGGYFELPAEAGLDGDAAAESLDRKEFIFDVQGHFVNPDGAWLARIPSDARPLRQMPKAGCALGDKGNGGRAYLECLGRDQFIKDVFMDSDTDMMVLSFIPSSRETEPLTIEEAAATRDIVAAMEGSHRLLVHGRVNPNQDGDIDFMDELARKWKVSAFKTYTQWGPGGDGFFLTDEIGIAFIEKARALGVKNIAIHKGLPFGRESYAHSTCRDIGPVARRFPDMNFLVYHSGFVAGQPEGEYDPRRTDGIDALITSVIENDVANANVYAELGSTWRYLLRDPDSAAHALGKLFRYIGENNVLWGTDSIWYGSPQDQIQAFRTFQISKEFQQRFGYAPITPGVRAKVFGLNAMKPYGISAVEMQKRMAGDRVAREKLAYAENPDPHFRTYGPKTRREFLNLLANGG